MDRALCSQGLHRLKSKGTDPAIIPQNESTEPAPVKVLRLFRPISAAPLIGAVSYLSAILIRETRSASLIGPMAGQGVC